MSKSSTMPKLEFTSSSEPWKPHEYQKKAMRFLLERPCGGLFLDPGLGKTSTTLGAVKVLLQKGICKRVLIIAPLRVAHGVWPVEIEKWTDFNHLRVVVLHGKDKEKLLKTDADIYVINPEGLSWLMGAGRMRQLAPDTLVVDESSKFKHSGTARFKLLKPYLPKFARRWILTGTPASNGLMDLFGQCYIMDLGKALGQYITHYRMKYFNPVDHMGYTWAPKPGAEQEIYEALRPYVLRLSAEDYLELPQLIENIIKVDLPPAARKLYTELEDDMLSVLGDGGTVAAASAASAAIKCQQVANGAVYRDPPAVEDGMPCKRSDEWIEVHGAKIEALRDLVEELQGSPLLVAYTFRHDLARLQKEFGKDVPYIGGGVSAAKTADIVRRWNAGQIPVLLGHPASMGHGLNMQESCRHVAWFSNTYDFELDDQFIRRVYRQGNKESHVTIHRFVGRDTVDEQIVTALRRKCRNQNALLDALRDLKDLRMGKVAKVPAVPAPKPTTSKVKLGVRKK